MAGSGPRSTAAGENGRPRPEQESGADGEGPSAQDSVGHRGQPDQGDHQPPDEAGVHALGEGHRITEVRDHRGSEEHRGRAGHHEESRHTAHQHRARVDGHQLKQFVAQVGPADDAKATEHDRDRRERNRCADRIDVSRHPSRRGPHHGAAASVGRGHHRGTACGNTDRRDPRGGTGPTAGPVEQEPGQQATAQGNRRHGDATDLDPGTLRDEPASSTHPHGAAERAGVGVEPGKDGQRAREHEPTGRNPTGRDESGEQERSVRGVGGRLHPQDRARLNDSHRHHRRRGGVTPSAGHAANR